MGLGDLEIELHLLGRNRHLADRHLVVALLLVGKENGRDVVGTDADDVEVAVTRNVNRHHQGIPFTQERLVKLY